jgi:hypothetical protein
MAKLGKNQPEEAAVTMRQTSAHLRRTIEGNGGKGSRPLNFRFAMAALLFLTALFTVPGAARPQSNGESWQGGNSRWRAFQHARREACSFKSVGSVCSFSLEGKKYTGSCQPIEQGRMVCRNAVGHRGLNYNGPIYNGLSIGDVQY